MAAGKRIECVLLIRQNLFQLLFSVCGEQLQLPSSLNTRSRSLSPYQILEISKRASFFFSSESSFFDIFSLKLPFLLVSQVRKTPFTISLALTHSLVLSDRWTFHPFSAPHARPLLESDRLEVGIRFVVSEPAQWDFLHSWSVQRIILMPAHGRW